MPFRPSKIICLIIYFCIISGFYVLWCNSSLGMQVCRQDLSVFLIARARRRIELGTYLAAGRHAKQLATSNAVQLNLAERGKVKLNVDLT